MYKHQHTNIKKIIRFQFKSSKCLWEYMLIFKTNFLNGEHFLILLFNNYTFIDSETFQNQVYV